MKDKKEVPLLEKRLNRIRKLLEKSGIDFSPYNPYQRSELIMAFEIGYRTKESDVLRAIKEFDRKMNLLECADMIRTSNGMKCPWTPEGVALMELVRSSFKELFGEGGSE